MSIALGNLPLSATIVFGRLSWRLMRPLRPSCEQTPAKLESCFRSDVESQAASPLLPLRFALHEFSSSPGVRIAQQLYEDFDPTRVDMFYLKTPAEQRESRNSLSMWLKPR